MEPIMYTDDYHDNFLRPENEKDLEEIIGYVNIFYGKNEKWQVMYSDIKKCIEMFGYMNVSLYFNEYMKYGDHIEEFLSGFWVNLREADYKDEGFIEFENAYIMIENGFMYVQNRYITNKLKNVDYKLKKNIIHDKRRENMPAAKKPAKKTTAKKPAAKATAKKATKK
jgi:hypothetical protein